MASEESMEASGSASLPAQSLAQPQRIPSYGHAAPSSSSTPSNSFTGAGGLTGQPTARPSSSMSNLLPAKSPSGGSAVPLSYWEESQRINQPSGGDAHARTAPIDNRMQLFIGNLPFRVRWQDVKDLFRKCGTVLRADVALTPENRSKGFGTVLFAHDVDAYRAIDVYNGYNWQGRPLEVRPDLQDPTGSIALSLASVPQPNTIANIPQFMNSNNGWINIIPNNTHIYPAGQIPVRQNTNSPVPGGLLASGVGMPPRPASSASMRMHGTAINSAPLNSRMQRSHSNASSEDPRDANISSSSMSERPSLQQSQFGNVSHAAPTQMPQMVPVFMPQHMQAGPPAAGFVPYGFGGPAPHMNGGLMNYYQLHQNQARQGHVPPAYSNRHLFVGNLPFNTQWQDLKDLFRNAGNILRADVHLGPDGRSRGFGTVLFATPEDAMRAVDMFNGFEYSGRPLKVNFDKFSQNQHHQPIQPSSLAHANTSGPLHMSESSSGPPFAQHSQLQAGLGMSEAAMPQDDAASDSTRRHTIDSQDGPSSTSQVQTGTTAELRRTPETQNTAVFADNNTNTTNMVTPGSNSYSMHLLSHGRRHHASALPGPLHFQIPNFGASNGMYSTGPAALMSPQPTAAANSASNGNDVTATPGFNPLSPQTSRLTMTPSMPGFSFHPFPQTPPLMPQFLSPGVGPFSPPAHSQPSYNPAPGAPLHFQHALQSPGTPGFSSMLAGGYFPQMQPFQAFEAPMLADVLAMNQVRSTQQQQQQQEQQQQEQQQQHQQSVGAKDEEGKKRQPTDQSTEASAEMSTSMNGNTSGPFESKVSTTSPRPNDGDRSYFPNVDHASNALSQGIVRRASTNSGKADHLRLGGLGQAKSVSPNTGGSRSASTSATKATFDANADMSLRLSDLNLRDAALSDTALKSPRRASMFNDLGVGSAGGRSGQAGLGKPISSSHLRPSSTVSNSRRASFEAGTSANSKLEFGKSIWS